MPFPHAPDQRIHEILSRIVLAIVEDTDQVRIEAVSDEIGGHFDVTVNDADAFRLIGRRGDTARAIRVVALAVANKYRRKCKVTFAGESSETA